MLTCATALVPITAVNALTALIKTPTHPYLHSTTHINVTGQNRETTKRQPRTPSYGNTLQLYWQKIAILKNSNHEGENVSIFFFIIFSSCC